MERVQVRVAALAERLGGFGTCAPGTWSRRASTYGHSGPALMPTGTAGNLGLDQTVPQLSSQPCHDSDARNPLPESSTPRSESSTNPDPSPGHPVHADGQYPIRADSDDPTSAPAHSRWHHVASALGSASPGHTTTTHRRSPYYGAASKPKLHRQPGGSGTDGQTLAPLRRSAWPITLHVHCRRSSSARPILHSAYPLPSLQQRSAHGSWITLVPDSFHRK